MRPSAEPGARPDGSFSRAEEGFPPSPKPAFTEALARFRRDLMRREGSVDASPKAFRALTNPSARALCPATGQATEQTFETFFPRWKWSEEEWRGRRAGDFDRPRAKRLAHFPDGPPKRLHDMVLTPHVASVTFRTFRELVEEVRFARFYRGFAAALSLPTLTVGFCAGRSMV